MISEMSASIDALQARVAALEAAARGKEYDIPMPKQTGRMADLSALMAGIRAPESQTAAPALPQIGENWRMRNGWESGVLQASGSKTHPLQNDSNRTFTAAGRYFNDITESPFDLVSRISAAHVEPPPAAHIADAGEMVTAGEVAEFPWHPHNGSDKCPVPKRRRGELIVAELDGCVRLAEFSADWYNWARITRWRYTKPDPKPAKAWWGPWVVDSDVWMNFTGHGRVEWGDGGYIRHKVRI